MKKLDKYLKNLPKVDSDDPKERALAEFIEKVRQAKANGEDVSELEFFAKCFGQEGAYDDGQDLTKGPQDG